MKLLSQKLVRPIVAHWSLNEKYSDNQAKFRKASFLDAIFVVLSNKNENFALIHIYFKVSSEN